MDDNENLLDKIREMFGGIPGQFNVMEEQIDIDLQMNYFDLSRNVKEKLEEETVIDDALRLFDPETEEGEKKSLLCRLASLDKPEAFRIIEKYLAIPDHDLHYWALMALQESKMLLESKFLDENQVFISTGLGGRGDKLRYFVVLIGNRFSDFSIHQKKLIKAELETCLRHNRSELEKLEFTGHIARLMVVIPLNVTIKDVFDEVINECNIYGDFLMKNFIITNVKELSYEEVIDFLSKQDKRTDGIDN